MAIAAVGLKTHIWNNNLKSIMLLVLYPFLLTGIVWACAFLVGGMATGRPDDVAPAFASNIVYAYWPMILTVCVIWFLIAWFFNTSMIRKLAHSHPVTRLEEPELYNLLENLSITAGIPTPRLEIIESHARNAFASGIDQKTYAVTVTRGLMNSLSKDELEAVLAHEVTHIINRDVRLLIVTVIFTGMVGFFAQLAWSNLRYGMVFSGGSGKNKGAGMLIMLGIVAVLWVGYMATLLMRFALSRRREFMADAGAVELTKNPSAMMRALMRIAGRDQIPGAPADISQMCIENSSPFFGMFATHPPIDRRIAAIAAVTGEQIPEAESLPPIGRGEGFAPDNGDHARNSNNPWLTRMRGARKKTPWE